MYKLKQIPEDFIVEEITEKEFLDQGKYSIFILTKKNYTTEDTIQTIARIKKIPRKKIGYAGIKDRTAITTQYISIETAPKNLEELKIKDIKLEFAGYLNEPLTLGTLKGNKFSIIARNLQKNESPRKISYSKNYFDKQRFSGNNVEIGKTILNKEYKKACDLIINHEGSYRDNIKAHLSKNKNDYVNALKTIPRKILMIYVHAYQSKIWNETVREYLKNKKEIGKDVNINEEIPIIGFSTEIPDGELQDIIYNIMEKEDITFRDFIIREMPELSFEGNKRKIFVEIKDLKIYEKEKDELNDSMYKVKIEFFLEKGAYATMAIKQMFE